MWAARELNCLYSLSASQPHVAQLWATGQWQQDKRSMITYDRFPSFFRGQLVKTLNTSTFAGARILNDPVRGMRIRPLNRSRGREREQRSHRSFR